MTSISAILEKQLPGRLLSLLREIGIVAVERGESVYLVGGVVRDAIIGRSNLDLDLVVEGKAISLARQLANAKGWEIKTHPRFGTAKLSWESFHLDLVTARSETYARPGALPTVKKGNIKEDLSRRDFTINAMAVRLNPDSFGELLDPHDGQNDLTNKLIRVLHRGSFSDDPTRIIRALRYEQRLDFHLEQTTEKLARQYLESLDTVTGERLWHELELILREKYPEKVICRADELGVLQKLHPALKGGKWIKDKFAKVRNGNEVSLSGVYLALLVHRLNEEKSEECIARLKMPGWAARVLRDTMRLKESLPSLGVPELWPSEIYRKLEHHIPETIQAAAIASNSPVIQQRLNLYLEKLRYIKPRLSGDDLQQMGAKPGKKIGKILKTLHEANLDQKVKNREEEVALVRELL